MHSVLFGKNNLLWEWLESAGITIDQTHRVVIDINVNDVVRVYVEGVGSDKMLAVKPPSLEGAQISIVDKGGER